MGLGLLQTLNVCLSVSFALLL